MSEDPPPFDVVKLPFRVNPTVFPTDTQSMSSTRSGTSAAQSAAQQRPSTAGRSSSSQSQRNQVEFARPQSQQVPQQQQQEMQQQHVQIVPPVPPVDRRATGSALEHPVIFDGRPYEAVLNELAELEKQVNAVRYRFRGVISQVEDLNFGNSKLFLSIWYVIY